MSEVIIVNVVGSGAVSSEFDLKELSSVFGSKAEYDPENYPGMYFRFEDNLLSLSIEQANSSFM
jgi:transcription initiation factor TFIID TATA-box-binding protein